MGSEWSKLELRELVDLEAEKKIDHSRAKKIYIEMLETGKSLDQIVSSLSSTQDITNEIESYIQSIFEKYKNEYKRLSDGETKLINFFIGIIMKESKGKYSPSDITKYLNKKFNV